MWDGSTLPAGRGRGTRQRIYILGCLGDLERQRKNHAAASEHFDRAIELARATFILAEKKDE
jgi:MarR-like DNA-binding transcriptional regulator SgrR of sgrS sRNA